MKCNRCIHERVEQLAHLRVGIREVLRMPLNAENEIVIA